MERIERDGRAFLRIDLREIPTFVLNCTEDRQKRTLMQEQMSELGMNCEFVNTLRVTPGWVGVALGHLKVLRLTRARPPFLVLEDDCVFDEDFQAVIEVPAEADCLYLSASLFGLERPGQMSWGKDGRVIWERHDAGFLRVYNMLARHALLYLTPGFQKAVVESQVEALTNRHLAHMGDIGLAMLQPACTALLTERSMCRQVNRSATGGLLAERLPGNEWVGGKVVERTSQRSPRPGARASARLDAGLISDRYRFIYLPIGKNASSTLKAELRKPHYACRDFTLGALDEDILKAYFKFTFLRDPVSRLVSAYQEISLRHEINDFTLQSKPFLSLPDGPARFEAFLDELEKGKWDWRVFTQKALLGHVPLDFCGRVESLAAGLQTVWDQLGLGPCPELPQRRSRDSRKSGFGHDRFNIDHRKLSTAQIGRIRALYQEDVDLLQAFCPDPPLFTGGAPGSAAGQPGAGGLHADPLVQGADVALPAAGDGYLATLRLRGGAVHEFEVSAASADFEALRGLMSADQAAQCRRLFQLPLRQGRSALTFSGSDVCFLSLAPLTPAGPERAPRHRLTQAGDGHPDR